MGSFPLITVLPAIGLLLICFMFCYVFFVLHNRIAALEKTLGEVDKNMQNTAVCLRNILLTAVFTQQGVNTLLSLMTKKDDIVDRDEAQKEGIKIH